ncbi:MAG: NUDIX domain-containing protein [Candidatus Aenigmarchaeota archaeon]|nr:NUDIX domain-containing protein [Candidatus Aenigmarchaeota archaeon]
MVIHTVLCYLIKDNKVLLQKKSKGLFGGGKWNGPGGKINKTENPHECAKREILEEVGVKVSNFEKCGLLKFFRENELFIINHVFLTKKFEGNPKSGKEGVVNWFNFDELPLKEMWPDDKVWMPLMLQEKKFEGDFYFDNDYKKLIDHKINVI